MVDKPLIVPFFLTVVHYKRRVSLELAKVILVGTPCSGFWRMLRPNDATCQLWLMKFHVFRCIWNKRRQQQQQTTTTNINKQQTTTNNNKQQTTNNKQQTTSNKQQTTNNKQQTTNNKQQTTNNKQQTTNNKQQQQQQQQQEPQQLATMHWDIFMHASLCNHQWISVIKAHLTLSELWPTMTLWPKGTGLKVQRHNFFKHINVR